MQYDPSDPQLGGIYGNGGDMYTPDQPTDPPASGAVTPEEQAAAQQWAQQYYTQHQIPAGYGEVQDLMNTYLAQRQNGVSHQQAMDVTPGLLGWDKYTPPGGGGDNRPGGGPPAPTMGGGGGNVQSAMDNFPQFTPPDFTPQVGLTAPNPYTFTPFSYKDFSAPTLEEAQNQPGYQFGLKQGQDALQNSAAARGTLRGGGTLKDLFGYTNAAAEQNYGNVFNQDLTTYNAGRDNAFGTWAANTGAGLDAWNANWGATRDVNNSINGANQTNYQDAYQNAAGKFNPLFQASTLTFQDAYQRWLAKLNSLTNIATAGAA